jgi:threonylcarbamoyladenosine tRNA methylthiotransferase MtaB
MNNTVALYTLGCKLNFSETSTIGNQFKEKGYQIVDYKQKADIYILNTCTVTDNADKECRQYVRKALRLNPDAFIIVMGCYAQLRPEEITSIEGVDAVLGSNEKFKLFSLIEDFNKKDHVCVYVSSSKDFEDFGPAHSTDADSRTRAFFKLQDGCDYKCSYCTIPMARGKSRSMDFNNAVSDFSVLVNKGYKEIVLTGVNIGDYRKDDLRFEHLIKSFIEIPGDFRIRISSIEPNLLTDKIIDMTAETDKLCNHFHIPLQSGSAKVLKLMQRRYNLSTYEKLIYKIKSKLPDCCIGADVIVGFPGETNDEFLNTYNFLKDLPLSYLHVFTYSERPNTKAVLMEGSVEKSERRKRNLMLTNLSHKKRQQFYSEMNNKILNVLFESESYNNVIKGFSSNYIRTGVPFKDTLVNKFADVKIGAIVDNYCHGSIIDI